MRDDGGITTEGSTSKKKSGSKMWLNLLYIALIIGVLAYFALHENNIDNIIAAFSSLKRGWVIAGCVFAASFLIVEGFAQYTLTRCLCPEKKISFFNSLRTTLIGQFYSSITPSSTGGQPMQVLDMYKYGISVGMGSSILMIRFATHQMALFISSLIAFITQYAAIKNFMPSFIAFGVFGMLFNLAAVMLVVVATVSTKMTHAIMDWVMRVLVKLRLVKHEDKWRGRIDSVLVDFHEAGMYLFKHFGQMTLMVFCDLMFFFCMFSVTYCLYRAFGLNEMTFPRLVLLQAFLHSAVYFFPLPGASGASEGAFLLLFKQVFTSKVVFSAMLLWRFLTFYTKIIAGAAVIIGNSISEAVKAKRSPSAAASDAQPESGSKEE